MAPAKLFFLCGKMAAGKSTLAIELARQHHAVLLKEDEFLEVLFPGEITDIATYVSHSSRVKAALTPLIHGLLTRGVPVVLDFPANTPTQRAWFRDLCDRANAEHELHLVDASDATCRSQLRSRSSGLPEGTRWMTDAEYDAVTRFFEPPAAEERFNVIRHSRG